MKVDWLEKISGEDLIKRNSGGIFFRIEVGQAGTSRANCRYILREVALDEDNKYESIYLQNLSDNLAVKANSYARFVSVVSELLGQKEDREVRFGNERTFYRVIISFGLKVPTALARKLTGKYFQNYFPLTPILAVVHQNTEHTHIHSNLQSRNISGKKLHFDHKTYKSLDIVWGHMFAEHFGAHHLETHLEKKAETREYKRALARGESRERPERYHLTRNDFHEQERRSAGYEKVRDYRDQPEIAIESERIRERAIEIATRETDSTKQFVQREIERERPSERREQLSRAIIASERIVEREVEREPNNGQTQQRTDQLLARTIGIDTRTVSTVRELREGVTSTIQYADSRFERTDQQTRDSIAEIGHATGSSKGIERDLTTTTKRTKEVDGQARTRIAEFERTQNYTRERTSEIERADSRLERTNQYTREAASGVERTTDNSKQIERDITAATSRTREEYSRTERTDQCCRQIERGIDGLTERTRELVISREREHQLSREIERERNYPSR